MLAAQIVPSLIFTLVGGVIADRIRPQLVIIAGNLMIALGEGTFGILVLAGHPRLWQMIVLETRDRHRHGHLLPGVARRCCRGWCPASCCSRPARSAGWR